MNRNRWTKAATALAATSLSLGVALVGAPASAATSAVAQAEYDCPRVHTTDHYAYTWCRVYKGKVRLIADCALQPIDMYSGWIYPKPGNPTQRLQAGPCPYGLGPNSGPQGVG